jgi:hypothetical protein
MIYCIGLAPEYRQVQGLRENTRVSLHHLGVRMDPPTLLQVPSLILFQVLRERLFT